MRWMAWGQAKCRAGLEGNQEAGQMDGVALEDGQEDDQTCEATQEDEKEA